MTGVQTCALPISLELCQKKQGNLISKSKIIISSKWSTFAKEAKICIVLFFVILTMGYYFLFFILLEYQNKEQIEKINELVKKQKYEEAYLLAKNSNIIPKSYKLHILNKLFWKKCEQKDYEKAKIILSKINFEIKEPTITSLLEKFLSEEQILEEIETLYEKKDFQKINELVEKEQHSEFIKLKTRNKIGNH